ncbi:8-oxo-dGDP phosphatase NUDT18 [Sceloporus undulatus]|uniref:8-oxo-dGDP phosphatase NUDT18 n=1 Tax=Sceloporus undulatus TaxID=8520 RepID=UPI001C4AFB03|nr:8-oxo-dGDP phosphatase NUDT18 [Sceloporus undulatus]
MAAAAGSGSGPGPSEEARLVLGGQGWPLGPDRGSGGRGYDSAPLEPPEPARLRRNTCYIVLAVLLNEKKEVLVMQEAKPECYGSWYLPAGRMEPRETVLQALRREVKEETGLLCQPLTLLAVEERGPGWIRFVFLARPTGGTLKTLQEADGESLQAQWWNRKTPALTLRARDILPLMELGLQYQACPGHPPVLPAELPCPWICQRLLLLFTGGNGSGGDLWVLLATAGAPHLPVAASGLSPSELGERLLVGVHRLLRRCLPAPCQASARVRGLLGVQHLGKEPGRSDGICFNVVATLEEAGRPPKASPPALQSPDFAWWKVEDAALRSKILQRLSQDAFVPVRS